MQLPIPPNTCIICGLDTTTEGEEGIYFEIQGQQICLCLEHSEPFRLGILIGKSELNSRIVDILSNVEDITTGAEIKKAVYGLVPYAQRQVMEHKRLDIFKPINPRDLYSSLDSHIIGQDYAKRIVSLGVYEHTRAITKDIKSTSPDKHNVMLIGPSGCGKTLIAHTVASKLDLPFVSSDATSFSPTGFQGADSDSIITDLLEKANKVVRSAERGIIFLDEIDKLASSQSSSTREQLVASTQNTLLRLIEGKIVKTPNQMQAMMTNVEQASVDTSKMLWFFGGAFPGLSVIVGKKMGHGDKLVGFKRQQGDDLEAQIKSYEILSKANMDVLVESLIEYGMSAEFIGRIPVIAPLAPLNREELKSCLISLDHSPVVRQTRLFDDCGLDLVIEEDALDLIVETAYKMATGTRALNSLTKKAVSRAAFELLGDPKTKKVGKVYVTKDCITDPSLYRLEKIKRQVRSTQTATP